MKTADQKESRDGRGSHLGQGSKASRIALQSVGTFPVAQWQTDPYKQSRHLHQSKDGGVKDDIY